MGSITVMVKAGTRQETLENSSVSQFIGRLALQGTQSKSEVEQAIDRWGQIDVSVESEVTRFSILVDQASVNEAVALLADCLLNPVFDGVQVEAEKPGGHKNESSMDPENNAHEQAHYTAFRDHFLGQLVSGIRDNVYSITSQHLKDFHHKYYVSERIVVSGAGNINPDSFNEVGEG
jgi:processing peptidase subunit beta